MTKHLIADLTKNEQKRIFNKIHKDPKTGCWNWTAAKIKHRGYGAFNFRGKTQMVHRLMYSFFVKQIPYGMKHGVIDHSCNNRSCCNPEHLTFGTQKRNALRGDSPPSMNSRKTTCIRGHNLPMKYNEKWSKNRRGRRCVICRRINASRRYQSNRKNPEFVKKRKEYWRRQYYGNRHTVILAKHRVINLRYSRRVTRHRTPDAFRL